MCQNRRWSAPKNDLEPRTHQLAGHAANLEFWVGEVVHALQVINGYGERFDKLRAGERSAVEENGLPIDLFRNTKPLRPSLSDHQLKELRRSLLESASRLLSRCYREKLISESEIDHYGQILDLDLRDLKRS